MMTFSNPRFLPRPIYIRAEVESNNKQAKATFKTELDDFAESHLIHEYSKLINELVDQTIKEIINHFIITTNGNDRLIERYVEDILNDTFATRLFYDGQDVSGCPRFSIEIYLDDKNLKRFNTYHRKFHPFGLDCKIYFPYRFYLKGNDYRTLKFTYTTQGWMEYKREGKGKSAWIVADNIWKVSFFAWKTNNPAVPYHEVREIIGEQYWLEDLKIKIADNVKEYDKTHRKKGTLSPR